jgi:hypothetical protein
MPVETRCFASKTMQVNKFPFWFGNVLKDAMHRVSTNLYCSIIF